MRPLSRDLSYGTSGVMGPGPDRGALGADQIPSSVRLKSGGGDAFGGPGPLLVGPVSKAQSAQGGLIGAGDKAGGSAGVVAAAAAFPAAAPAAFAASYFTQEVAELRDAQLFGGGPLVRNRVQHQFKSGAVYDGQMIGNVRDGWGTQTWPDGARYQGEWSNNSVSGMGCFSHGD
ncbi:unnamed protein product, partial [Polarella glacialis]